MDGPKIKKQALAKLNNITAKIGYPDVWKDYSKLHFVEKDAVANQRQLLCFQLREACRQVESW